MDVQELGSIGELVGAIATVATLAYLAFQIRQNTLHARAYAQRDILSEVIADNQRCAQVAPLTRRGLSEFASLNPDEQFEVSANLVSLTTRFEASLRLYRAGLLDDVLFQAHRGWALAWITTPGGREWWDLMAHNYSEDVREFIQHALDNAIDLPPPITEAVPFYGIGGGGAR